jgi:hypothetical protein
MATANEKLKYFYTRIINTVGKAFRSKNPKELEVLEKEVVAESHGAELAIKEKAVAAEKLEHEKTQTQRKLNELKA